MKQGVIILIPKPGKDPKILDNLQPITLLNNDYKLLAHICSNRLKSGLSQIISNMQSGFMRGRSIHNNLHLVQDLIDYKDKINDDGIMFFLDFYKAFDTLEHPFVFSALELFGFGKQFRSIISSLYRDTNCSVSLIEGTTSQFNISRGVKQGSPISPLLFILAAEMLALAIKNSDIEQLKIFDDSIVISQLADGTVLFLNNIDQVPKTLQIINTFSNALGLCLNLSKCEIMTLKESQLTQSCNVPVKSTFMHLADAFIQSDLHCIQVTVLHLISSCFPWESNPYQIS